MIGKVWTRRSYLLPVINIPSIIATAIVAIAVAYDRRNNISYQILNIIFIIAYQGLYHYSSEARSNYWRSHSIVKVVVSSTKKTINMPGCNPIVVMRRENLSNRFYANDLISPFMMLQKTPECRQIMFPGTQFKAISVAL